MNDQVAGLPEGFRTDAGFDPAEDNIGPFYYREEGETTRFAFVADERHCNVTGVVHGGVLMTFADYAACMVATDHYATEDCVTVSFSSDFLAGGHRGVLIECRASLNRKTRSMVFVTGTVTSGESILLTFSSVMKRLPRE